MTRRIEIIQQQTVFNRFIFRIEELHVRHEKFDGTMGAPIKRLVIDRGDSAAVLLHDVDADLVLLCEQFRAATMAKGSGWLTEIPAGMIDDKETADACARRETYEETGQNVGILTHVATVYPSPGGSSERVHIFYGAVSLRLDLPKWSELSDEEENILIKILPVNEAFSLINNGAVEDAKTVIALQWLEKHIGDGKKSQRVK